MSGVQYFGRGGDPGLEFTYGTGRVQAFFVGGDHVRLDISSL